MWKPQVTYEVNMGEGMPEIRYRNIALLALSIILIAGCTGKETAKAKELDKPAARKAAQDSSVQQKVLSFNLEGLTQKGAKSWEVKGETAEAISENRIRLDNIIAKAYGEEAEATITADEGVYDKSRNNVTLEKNVKATIENSAGFSGEYANFTNPIAPSHGKPRKNTPTAQKKGKIIITCDAEVQFDYGKNQAYFNKNVKVKSEDGDIDADRITMNLDPATKKIRDIVAEGNVKITRGDNVTYSDNATYVEAEKKIVLTGNPRLIIYQEGDTQDGFTLDGGKGKGSK